MLEYVDSSIDRRIAMEQKFDILTLDNQLCFPLYAASREIIKLYRPQLDALNLTYTQYIAMMVLWEKKKINSKELGRRLFLDSGTLTPVLKSLEAKGWVNRYRSADDERMLMVEITAAGEALREKALNVPQAITDRIHLNSEENAQLRKLLHKILNACK